MHVRIIGYVNPTEGYARVAADFYSLVILFLDDIFANKT